MIDAERNELIMEEHALVDSDNKHLKYIAAEVLLKRANQLLDEAYQDHLTKV